MFIFINAFLIGTASGLRALIGLAVVSWAAHIGVLPIDHTWLAFLGNAFTPYILTLMAIGELVNDKLPKTPSRLIPPSVHRQNRDECSVRSCDRAFWLWNDRWLGGWNFRSCGRDIRRSQGEEPFSKDIWT
jgi:hypothetical protein